MQNNETARTERSIVKAEPGWFAVLRLIRAGKKSEIRQRWDDHWDDHLVLAPIERHDERRRVWHDVTPITVDDPPITGIRYIKRPDGRFICGDAIEDNEKDAIAHIKAEEDETREAEDRQRQA